MKFTSTLIASLSAVAAAAPANHASKPPRTFSGIALRSASPIHFAPVTAHDGAIWLNGKTKSFCPHSVLQHCPKGKDTAFGRSGKSSKGYSLSMDTEVPGGQFVFIDKHGRVRYTEAHSGVIPEGSITAGWEIDTSTSSSAFLSHKQNLVACKTDGDEYAVYVARPGFDKKHCLGFDIEAEQFKGVAAWQYD